MMYQLPTRAARILLEEDLKPLAQLSGERNLALDAIREFQRIAAVSDIETATIMMKALLKPDVIIGEPLKRKIQLVYDLTKPDILGTAIDALTHIAQNTSTASKDRLAAAAVINELYGEKHLIQDGVLTDKLVVNLVGDK